MSIGERLKQCRVALGYSAEVVAEKLGVSPATMYRYENGDIEKMPAHLLEPLARFLNTTPGFIMGWSDDGAPAIPVVLSDEDTHLLRAFHAADPSLQAAVRKLLDLPETKDDASSQSAM